MWVRKRLDLGWSDVAFALASCFRQCPRARLAEVVESSWLPPDEALACLSVRSGLDLLLSALALPSGSEVLVSAITIPDMVRIIKHHGLVPVPVDVEPHEMGPDLGSLARTITPSTRAILVAHLFGGQIDMEPTLAFAREHGLLVIEDCAQAFAGSEYVGHGDADVAMFSFGPIKTATALGGAVLRVRNRELLDQMRRLLATYPVQGRWAYLRRGLKMSVLKLFEARPLFATVVGLCRLLGVDYDRLINGAARGFTGPRFVEQIRSQPCGPLLATLGKRLAGFDAAALARQRAGGQHLKSELACEIICPGVHARSHTHWVFPIVAPDPKRLIARLRRAGFDATGAASMTVVPTPKDRPDQRPVAAERVLAKIVHLPCYSAIPPCELDRLADIVRSELTPSGRTTRAPASAMQRMRGQPGLRI